MRETDDIPDTKTIPTASNAEMMRQVISGMIESAPKRTQERKDLLSNFTAKDAEMRKAQQKERSDLISQSFGKREAEIKRRREKYPFASIQKGIAAGMKEPTIAMMFTQGVAVTGEELEKKADELDNMTDALEGLKFGAKSKEMSDAHSSNLTKLKNDTDLQLRFLSLDESEQQRIAALLAKGMELDVALATVTSKSKVGKITQPYLNDRNAVIRSALKFQGDFQVVDGKAVFTGKNDKGQNLTGNDYRKIAEVEAKYDGYYNAAIRAKNTPSEAAEYAKKLTLLDNKGTNTPPPPPPPGGKPPVASNIPPPANLAPQIPTFGSN